MPTYIGNRKDGSSYKVEWSKTSPISASVEKMNGSYCLFCLEDNNPKGIGLLVDGACSNACERSSNFLSVRKRIVVQAKLDENIDNLSNSNLLSESRKSCSDYLCDTRAVKYGLKGRSGIIFSELVKVGADGIMISDLISVVSEVTGESEKTIKADVSSKLSRWTSLKNNNNQDDWWILSDKKAERGRPAEGTTKDRKVWIVFRQDDIPISAYIPPPENLPYWVVKKTNGMSK
jgi:hypothetical protein